jgi:hypothetical protein
MPRTILALQYPTSSGITPAYSTPDTVNGNMFSNDGQTILHVKNASGGSINVTLTTPNAPDGNAVADKIVAVPAGAERMISNLSPAIYSQPGSSTDVGYCYVDFSSATSVTAACFHP